MVPPDRQSWEEVCENGASRSMSTLVGRADAAPDSASNRAYGCRRNATKLHIPDYLGSPTQPLPAGEPVADLCELPAEADSGLVLAGAPFLPGLAGGVVDPG